MLICRNAEGVHGQRKVGKPWHRMKALVHFSSTLLNASESGVKQVRNTSACLKFKLPVSSGVTDGGRGEIRHPGKLNA